MLNHFKTMLYVSLFCLGYSSVPHIAQAQDAEILPKYSEFPAEAWRDVEAENLILIDTVHGVIGVEIYPEISPNHGQRIRELARRGFYDDVPFHRVIEGFMNQTGDGENGNGTGDSELPNLTAEFTFRRSPDMPMIVTGKRNYDGKSIEVGFYKAMPMASKPISQAFLTKDGKVEAFGLHCKGVTSMARTNDPNSANAQFFLMRGKTENLDKSYTIWGNTVLGREHVESPKVGVINETPGFVPDRMITVRVAADLPEDERPKIQVLKTDGPSFEAYLQTQKKLNGANKDICDIVVPTRTL